MVGSTTNSAAYAGNGSTSTPYTIPFRYDSASWVAVTLTAGDGTITDLVQGTDYTLHVGTFTTSAAHASDTTVTVWRETPGLQDLSLESNVPLPAISLEAALDRAAMAAEDSTRPRKFWGLSVIVMRLKAIIDALNPLHWESIVDKPSFFPPIEHLQGWDTIVPKPTEFPPAYHTQAWDTITSKPSFYPPDLTNKMVQTMDTWENNEGVFLSAAALNTYVLDKVATAKAEAIAACPPAPLILDSAPVDDALANQTVSITVVCPSGVSAPLELDINFGPSAMQGICSVFLNASSPPGGGYPTLTESQIATEIAEMLSRDFTVLTDGATLHITFVTYAPNDPTFNVNWAATGNIAAATSNITTEAGVTATGTQGKAGQDAIVNGADIYKCVRDDINVWKHIATY